jgi:hypothetical protein
LGDGEQQQPVARDISVGGEHARIAVDFERSTQAAELPPDAHVPRHERDA